jgi:hypothetical protein
VFWNKLSLSYPGFSFPSRLRGKKFILFFIFAFVIINPGGLWAQTTPATASDSAFDAAAQGLQEAQKELQELKGKWDRARLETTLYDKRAKRAYQRWVKASKKLKEQAKAEKEKAELEFQLALEKRKLAGSRWQAAQLRELATESEVKALDQDRDTKAIEEKIKQLEEKLPPAKAADSH